MRKYLCIDLKSFYASVECVERGLDPLTTNLVVADPERSEKTICLAITPSLKALGIRNRCRVFEIPKNVPYLMAEPRMSLYIQYAADIYSIYLKYISKEDIFVYSIDEAFMDVTDYLEMYHMDARSLGQRILKDILFSTGITATCGIGTNLYLAKIALDITAKHVEDHIGYLDEETFKRTLWKHKPLRDFWRIGPGTAERLSHIGVYTMEDIARTSPDTLYHMFGVDAELMIDHAFGRESTTIEDIKNYKSQNICLNSGQVLMRDYEYEEGLLIAKEMTDLLCLDLVEKGYVTGSVTLHVGYAKEENHDAAHGTISFSSATNSNRILLGKIEELYRRIVEEGRKVRRFQITFQKLEDEGYLQYDLFSDPVQDEKDLKIQKAVLDIKNKFGKDAILKGMNLKEGGTTILRNHQVGGHKSGR